MNVERWREFRRLALRACQRRQWWAAELMERAGIEWTRNTQRVAIRCLSKMVAGGFLVRGANGYETTMRGRRVLSDLEGLERVA